MKSIHEIKFEMKFEMKLARKIEICIDSRKKSIDSQTFKRIEYRSIAIKILDNLVYVYIIIKLPVLVPYKLELVITINIKIIKHKTVECDRYKIILIVNII